MASWKTHRMRTQKRSILPSTEKGQLKELIESHRDPVLSCEFHKSGQVFASSNDGGEIHICPTNSATEKLAYLSGHMEAITEVHYSTDGLDLYAACKDRCISVWDAFRAKRKTTIMGHNSGVNTVQCLRTSWPILCSGSSDKTVRVWDVRQRKCAALFESEHAVAAACFGNRYIYSGGFNDGDIAIWDIRQDGMIHVLAGHTDSVTGLALSPCGKYLASCSADGTLRKWDVSSPADVGTEIQSFHLGQGDRTHLRRCAWSPDGRHLSAGTSGSQVVVFDANNDETRYDGHSEGILDVAFHPRKNILCSAGADKKLIMHYM